ncbi:eamA-like transporter family protein, partial [Vibrio harveyi]
LKEISRF